MQITMSGLVPKPQTHKSYGNKSTTSVAGGTTMLIVIITTGQNSAEHYHQFVVVCIAMNNPTGNKFR